MTISQSIFIVMGVSGCGKTTMARMLAGATGGVWLDADDFHTAESKAKMGAGIPLKDEDRWPWLDRLNRELLSAGENHTPIFLACSALKQKYRDRLIAGLPQARFIYLKGSIEFIRSRLAKRKGHFMPPELLESQFADLEEPRDALVLDISKTDEEMANDFCKDTGLGKATMRRNRCGGYDLELPILGMGCWSYGGGRYWGAQNQQDVCDVVRYAVDCGCNYFDTAEAYNEGASETSLGQAIQGIPRGEIIIGTKISPSNAEPDKIVRHCEASLKRLKTGYIDLYMLHWPVTAHSIAHFTADKIPAPSVPDAFGALARLRKEGKIRHIGVSNFGVAKLSEALSTGVAIVANELPYSLLTRAIELEILPFCRERGIGVLGYMSLMQGVLSDRYPNFGELPEWRRRTRHFDSRRTPMCRHGLPGAEEETSAALQSIRAVAKETGMTIQELALKWVLAGRGITCSLCGSRDIQQLKSNIKAASEPLPAPIVEELEQMTRPLLEKLGPSFDYYENPANDRTK